MKGGSENPEKASPAKRHSVGFGKPEGQQAMDHGIIVPLHGIRGGMQKVFGPGKGGRKSSNPTGRSEFNNGEGPQRAPEGKGGKTPGKSSWR